MESQLTTRWLSQKNVLFKKNFPFTWLPNTGVKLPFYQNDLVFLQKLKYRCLVIKTKKLITLNHLLNGEKWPRAWLSQNFKPGRSLIHTVNFNGNLLLAVFSTRAPLRLWEVDEKWTWYQMWILCCLVITRFLEKFCQYLNDKLITTNNSLDDSPLDVNLSKNQKVI